MESWAVLRAVKLQKTVVWEDGKCRLFRPTSRICSASDCHCSPTYGNKTLSLGNLYIDRDSNTRSHFSYELAQSPLALCMW
jgi:hypothetical protein